ncbi:MAG: hypothetical protein KKA73_25055 [Chloroflexi bacterium]|nr:hypothetical protein [Chloroflexota bacterium]MBU1750966.1 hypothetical protein [Chloroflexota bacterium]MBU1879185.1 hypothetical protein [Chloroflexota bacterium]
MIARRSRQQSWLWWTWLWLGAVLMLGALALPVRASAGAFTTAAPVVDPRAAGQVRAALNVQGYAVTHVGLGSDGEMAGVIMPLARSAQAGAAWPQLQAGWQALADAYPQARWLLSAYPAGDRYLVCALVSRSAPVPAQAHVILYDTLLGRWVQPKDLTHKNFSRSSPLLSTGASPLPAPAWPGPATPARSGPTGDVQLLPAFDDLAGYIAMHGERRQPWPAEVRRALPATTSAFASPARLAPVGASADALDQAHASARTWDRHVYPARAATHNADTDPAGDPPAAPRPLLHARLVLGADSMLRTSPSRYDSLDAPPRPHASEQCWPSARPYLLVWPSLLIRPPPGVASC